MKVITFSTQFPTTHPRKGVKTFFPEQILSSLGIGVKQVNEEFRPYLNDFALLDGLKKVHTIRAGNRWKVREYFSPRIWTGQPYKSKQLQFAPPIQIKKIWTFRVDDNGIWLDDMLWQSPYDAIARNDGLDNQDFIDWLIKPYSDKNPFEGQVICWDGKIYY